jgi:hypothetical protein
VVGIADAAEDKAIGLEGIYGNTWNGMLLVSVPVGVVTGELIRRDDFEDHAATVSPAFVRNPVDVA